MKTRASQLIAIGGSAGAYEPIVEILDNLPPRITAAIVVVLHRNAKYKTKMETSLSERLGRQVLSIRDKTSILANQIYFAPPGYHTLVEPELNFSLDISEAVQFSRPSIDVFFESIAPVYQKDCIALLLSGANSDGADGFRSLLRYGASCYVQCPQEAIMETMPLAGLAVSPKVTRLNQQEIIELVQGLNKNNGI